MNNYQPLAQSNKMQQIFLNHCRKNDIAVQLECENATHIEGYIKGFDQDSVIVEQNGMQSLIYKAYIKIIKPKESLELIQVENLENRSRRPTKPRVKI